MTGFTNSERDSDAKRQVSPAAKRARVAGFVAGYGLVLVVCAAFALTADFGAQVGQARDTIAFAAAPVPVAPLVAAALGAEEAGGTLTGVIEFEGNVPTLEPKVKKGDLSKKDPDVCAAQDVPDESLVVNPKNKGIANVFIFLPKAPAGVKVPPPPSEPAVIDQKECRFIPHCQVIQAGTIVRVKNGDGVNHNTNIAQGKNPGFNKSIPGNDREGEVIKHFTKSDTLPRPIRCDFHNWMTAHIMVLDHPWAAVTDADGKFTIRNLPPGKHEFQIWHEKVGWLRGPAAKYPVEIKAGETKEVKLSFGAAKFTSWAGPRGTPVAINVP